MANGNGPKSFRKSSFSASSWNASPPARSACRGSSAPSSGGSPTSSALLDSVLPWFSDRLNPCLGYGQGHRVDTAASGPSKSVPATGRRGRVHTRRPATRLDPRGDAAADRRRGDSIVDQIDWRVYYDLDEQGVRGPPQGRQGFDWRSRRTARTNLDPRYFPVRSLLNTAGFFEACRRIQAQADDEHRQRRLDEADRLASAFRDYQLPLVSIREADLESAVTVFARLNRTGRRMGRGRAGVRAHLRGKDSSVSPSTLDDFKAELKKKGFGGLDRSVPSQIRARGARAGHLRQGLGGPHGQAGSPQEDSRKGSKPPSEASRLALEMLQSLGVTSDRLLPYGLQLVLLGEFHRICPRPSAETAALLRRWFWVTSFTGWFGGVNTAQAKRALDEIRNLAKGKSETFNVVDPDAPAEPFPRPVRRAKRPRARVPAVPGVASSSIARTRQRSGSGWAPDPTGNRRGGLRSIQSRSARTGIQSGEPDVRGRAPRRAGCGSIGGPG